MIPFIVIIQNIKIHTDGKQNGSKGRRNENDCVVSARSSLRAEKGKERKLF